MKTNSVSKTLLKGDVVVVIDVGVGVGGVALRQPFGDLRHRANITDLTSHDLRHEAISRLFKGGLKIHEVMAIRGHKTASQLFRYVLVVK